jgi:hypothetical protein
MHNICFRSKIANKEMEGGRYNYYEPLAELYSPHIRP